MNSSIYLLATALLLLGLVAQGKDFLDVATTEVEFDPTWPKRGVLTKLGQISGLAIQNRSLVYLFHRGKRVWSLDSFNEDNIYTNQEAGPIKEATIALLKDGKLVAEHGASIFFMPHSITLDHEGNVYVTDVALHQVIKFNRDDFGKPALILGQRMKPGRDEKHFCKPTDVAVARNGDIFISDGYCNSRILKFSKNGTLLKVWGDDLAVPHSLTLMENADAICVADRENYRVVCYEAGLMHPSRTGRFLANIKMDEFTGKPFAVASNEEFGEIYVLGSETILNKDSQLLAFDIDSLKIKRIIDPPQGKKFGMAHALRSCQTGSESANCVALVSLSDNCSPNEPCLERDGSALMFDIYKVANLQDSVVVYD